MNTIDLSKAKIGDKFKTDSGYVVQFMSLCRGSKYKYYVESADGKCWLRCDSEGNARVGGKQCKLIEKVIDKAEGKSETQRRQDVVELADRIFFSYKGNMYTFKECVEVAERCVNIRNQYLKDGKLC